MRAFENDSASPRATPDVLRRAAFRDLHGSRLHGFALLVTLGDQALAARLASDALAEGSARVKQLSHPERASAWLRQRIVRASRGRLRDAPNSAERRRAALELLDTDAVAFAGLAALDVRGRAALVASAVERLDRRDVATIVGMDGARLERLLHQANARFIRSAGRAMDRYPPQDGPIAARIRAIAERAMT